MIWALSVIASLWLGFYLRSLSDRIKVVELLTHNVVYEKKKEPEESQSILIDLDDPVKEARWEHEQLMKKLNPDE